MRAVLELWERARAEPSTGADAAGLEALLARDPEALLVAELDGAIVGTLIAAWDGWRGHMHRLAVDPACRRRGIACALVDEGERRLRVRGARRITAIVVRERAPANRFWAAAGYAVDERVGRYAKTL